MPRVQAFLKSEQPVRSWAAVPFGEFRSRSHYTMTAQSAGQFSHMAGHSKHETHDPFRLLPRSSGVPLSLCESAGFQPGETPPPKDTGLQPRRTPRTRERIERDRTTPAFVSGHGFSRAEKKSRRRRFLAAAGCRRKRRSAWSRLASISHFGNRKHPPPNMACSCAACAKIRAPKPMSFFCQAPHLFTKVTTPHSTLLPRQNTQSILACFIAGLGILIIGSNK